jgi:hypothetical protein
MFGILKILKIPRISKCDFVLVNARLFDYTIVRVSIQCMITQGVISKWKTK